MIRLYRTLLFALGMLLFCGTKPATAATPANYSVTDLGWNGSGPGGGAFSAVINKSGQVAGAGGFSTFGVAHGYLYSGGVTIDIGSLGGQPTYPFGINDAGQVVGQSTTAGGNSHAFLYSGGQMTDLGALPGDVYSTATGINGSGQVVGYSASASGTTRAYLYSPGTGMTDLSTIIGGTTPSYALAINSGGQVVGEFTASNGFLRAFRYTPGNPAGVTDLGALIGGGTVNSNAVRINASGQILIQSDLGGPNAGPFVYSGGVLTPIPVLPGFSPMYIEGFNSSGQVVGEAFCCHGFLYSGGMLTDLFTLGVGVNVAVAWDINDGGQIVVWGGEEYLLTPTASTSPTGSMNLPRFGHTATLLNNGLVLVTGGDTAQGAADTNTAELYNPQTGTWRYTGIGSQTVMGSIMEAATATQLGDGTGRVLIAGGSINTGFNFPPRLSSAEIFDPVTETFTPTGSMNAGRGSHVAVLLNDGRVLVVGGYTNGNNDPQAEIYDPKTQLWTVTPNIQYHGPDAALALLPNGRVLATGGVYTSAVDLFDPGSNTWQEMNPLLYIRAGNTASRLPNGTVLVAGGNNSASGDYNAEIYDVTASGGLGGSVVVPGNLTEGGWKHSVVSLPNGDVLLAGGQTPPPGSGAGDTGNSTVNVQLYSFLSNSFSSQPAMLAPRTVFPIILFPNTGQILICGGADVESGYLTALNSCEVRGSGPATGTINVTTNLPAATFTITGPATYNGSGTSFIQTNAPVGTYTITYGAAPCYSTPLSQTLTVAAGGAITFNGTYQGASTVSVNIGPAGASSATFGINPPIAGMRNTGPYPVTQGGVVPQAYTVTYGSVSGFNTPPTQTLSPDSSCHLSFSGSYSTLTGLATLTVYTNQSSRSIGTFTISDVTGKPLPNSTNISSFTNVSVPAGAYSVKYNSLPGFYTPLSQKVNLGSGGQATLEGIYRRLILVAFTGFNDAPTASDCFNPVFNNFLLPIPSLNVGAGIEYLPNQWNAPGRGMTTLLYQIQQNPALAQGAHLDAFTFYSTDGSGNQIGDACTATISTDADHYEATTWVTSLNPGPDDIVAVLGHSYGGNRARLFAYELQQEYGIPTNLLATVDPIDWDICSIEAGFLQVLQGGPFTTPCDQSGLTYAKGGSTELSFRQTLGVLPFNVGPIRVVIGNLKGYSLAGTTSTVESGDYHLNIDDDSRVQTSITNTLSTLTGPPKVVSSPGSATRALGQITVPLTISVSGLGTATGVTITSALLNGVPAFDLALAGSLGNIAAGSSNTTFLAFPLSAVPSGTPAVLSVIATYSFGQTLSNGFRVLIP